MTDQTKDQTTKDSAVELSEDDLDGASGAEPIWKKFGETVKERSSTSGAEVFKRIRRGTDR